MPNHLLIALPAHIAAPPGCAHSHGPIELQHGPHSGIRGPLYDRLGDRPVYLSIDIDVLDPAHAPSTGRLEAGGMTSREFLVMLRELQNVSLTGADIVEVAPAYDHAQITAIAASHVACEIISAIAPRER